MELNDLLNYQKVDMRIKKIIATLEKSDEKKQVESLKVVFSEAKKKMIASEAHADKIVASYNEAVNKLNDLEKKAMALIKKANDGENSTEILAELEAVKKALGEVGAKVNMLKEESNKALALFVTSQKEGKKSKEEYNVVSAKYEEMKAKADEELTPLKAEIGALREKVDKKLLEQYDILVAQNIPHPFVEVMGDDKNSMCGGCFMALSQSLIDNISKLGYCHCDSCKRILYKKK